MPVALRRVIEACVGLALLLAAVLWLSGGCAERIPPGSVELAVAVPAGERVPVEERSLPVEEWASGSVLSARHTAVSSRVLARIEEVRVRAGSSVQPGDVLVVLDGRDLEARLSEARQALAAAEAELELAQSEADRVEKLFREGVATRQRLDQAQARRRAARADVERLRHGVEEAQTALSHTVIRSPVAGRVVDRLAEPGDTAVPGQPLLRIYDPTLLRAEVPVRESLALSLRVGQPLRVELPSLGETLEGEIDEIVPFADPGARTLLVKVRLPPSETRLFAGLFARAAIPAGERRVLLVPAAAVQRVGQLEFAGVIRDGRFERRLVTTGPRRDSQLEVLSGLRAGETVLLPSS